VKSRYPLQLVNIQCANRTLSRLANDRLGGQVRAWCSLLKRATATRFSLTVMRVHNCVHNWQKLTINAIQCHIVSRDTEQRSYILPVLRVKVTIRWNVGRWNVE